MNINAVNDDVDYDIDDVDGDDDDGGDGDDVESDDDDQNVCWVNNAKMAPPALR